MRVSTHTAKLSRTFGFPSETNSKKGTIVTFSLIGSLSLHFNQLHTLALGLNYSETISQ